MYIYIYIYIHSIYIVYTVSSNNYNNIITIIIGGASLLFACVR